MGTFVHLNGHSEFSADSNADVRMIVKAAMNDGQKALALTDTNLAAVHGFHMEAERHGIKPIIGLDVRLVNDDFAAAKRSPAPYFDLTLLAQDRSGWQSLIALHNAALDSPGTHPIVDYALLEQHSAGLIAITGGRHCPVNTYLSFGLPDMASESLDRLEDALGTGRVFLGASEPAQAEQMKAFFGARVVHLVATARYRQVHELDGEEREELIRIRSGWNPVRMEAAGWVKTEQEMREMAPASAAWQDAVTMTATVADAIVWETVPDTGHHVPAFNVPDGFPDADSYLRHLAFRGAADRYDEIPLAVIEQLNLELEGIRAHRSADYVLLVEDLISWCDVQGILTSPRGTSSGSELLYCLGVTAIRPATHGLLFERLLAPGRTDLIDLDFDIQSSRRQEALDYLASRWPGRVARTSTFMKVRSGSPLNGRVKSASVHPCAILISRDPLATAVPLRRIGTKGDNLPVASWEIHALHGWGYMVLDLLGSVTLDVIAQTADAVRANPASRHRIGRLLADGDGDLYRDTTAAGWDLICSGDTDGVFMYGSDRMGKASKAIRPRNISDMAALLALRGDETQTAKYLADRALRPNGFHRHAHYGHITDDPAELVWIAGPLQRTHGSILFQEQIISLLRAVGGFDDAEAVRTWKLLAKLQHDTAPLREKFIAGAAQESYSRSGELVSPVFSEATAGRVFDLIIEAAPRAFTAAHAHSYARTAFQTAWLKANWPEEFQQVLDRVRPHRSGRVKA